LFVLATTSNPEAEGLQRSTDASGRSVSAGVIAEVSRRNAESVAGDGWGSAGFVIGATVDWSEAAITAFTPLAPILAPGFGAQGARPRDLPARFGEMAPCVIASESRSVLGAGPEALAGAVQARVDQYQEALHG
jgi:orotidine-5'-phosphate decarboxylase